MTRRMILYEVGKVLLLFLELVCVVAALYGAARLIWFGAQYVLAPLSAATVNQIAGAVPDKFGFARGIIRFFAADVTRDEAVAGLIRSGILTAAAGIILVPLRLALRLLERSFKQRYMPEVLERTFSDFTYEAKRRPAEEEALCEMGLLSRIERYYTANRLEGLYRDCWVASQEIICGGVYADRYTSHKVKVRGQWLSVHLNCDFDGTLILESRNTKNRFSHRALARKMVELEVDHQALAEHFAIYTNSTDDAKTLLTVEMAEKLMSVTELYPDLCVFFRQGNVHLLIRRRSFNRRWEPLCPFCFPQLRKEARRLYGPLQDVTDLLLE